jgi:carboxyl-terminal processing protease
VATAPPNEDLKEKRERWEKSLKKDPYISEAVEILIDLSTQIGSKKPIAEVKNSN